MVDECSSYPSSSGRTATRQHGTRFRAFRLLGNCRNLIRVFSSETFERIFDTLLQSNGPITLSLPPFRGATRRIVLLAAVIFVFFAIVGWILPDLGANLANLIALKPKLVTHGMIWLLITYPFAPLGFISELFALVSFWIFGAMLEDEFGGRWLWEYFLVSTAGGGVLTVLLSYALARYAPLAPLSMGAGFWPAGMAVLLAFAHFHPEEQLRVYFIIPIKAKHLVAAYVLLYLVFAVAGGDQFGAVLALCVTLSAFVYLRSTPRRGLRFAASEKWFGLRNEYVKSRRKRAGKKFAVYMKKQGEDVNIDADGRYIDPTDTPRDPNDKRWMN